MHRNKEQTNPLSFSVHFHEQYVLEKKMLLSTINHGNANSLGVLNASPLTMAERTAILCSMSGREGSVTWETRSVHILAVLSNHRWKVADAVASIVAGKYPSLTRFFRNTDPITRKINSLQNLPTYLQQVLNDFSAIKFWERLAPFTIASRAIASWETGIQYLQSILQRAQVQDADEELNTGMKAKDANKNPKQLDTDEQVDQEIALQLQNPVKNRDKFLHTVALGLCYAYLDEKARTYGDITTFFRLNPALQCSRAVQKIANVILANPNNPTAVIKKMETRGPPKAVPKKKRKQEREAVSPKEVDDQGVAKGLPRQPVGSPLAGMADLNQGATSANKNDGSSTGQTPGSSVAGSSSSGDARSSMSGASEMVQLVPTPVGPKGVAVPQMSPSWIEKNQHTDAGRLWYKIRPILEVARVEQLAAAKGKQVAKIFPKDDHAIPFDMTTDFGEDCTTSQLFVGLKTVALNALKLPAAWIAENYQWVSLRASEYGFTTDGLDAVIASVRRDEAAAVAKGARGLLRFYGINNTVKNVPKADVTSLLGVSPKKDCLTMLVRYIETFGSSVGFGDSWKLHTDVEETAKTVLNASGIVMAVPKKTAAGKKKTGKKTTNDVNMDPEADEVKLTAIQKFFVYACDFAYQTSIYFGSMHKGKELEYIEMTQPGTMKKALSACAVFYGTNRNALLRSNECTEVNRALDQLKMNCFETFVQPALNSLVAQVETLAKDPKNAKKAVDLYKKSAVGEFYAWNSPAFQAASATLNTSEVSTSGLFADKVEMDTLQSLQMTDVDIVDSDSEDENNDDDDDANENA